MSVYTRIGTEQAVREGWCSWEYIRVSRDNRHGNVSYNIGQATNRVNANKAGRDQGREHAKQSTSNRVDREHAKQSTSNRVEEDVLANAR
jgi:hypothetical protein